MNKFSARAGFTLIELLVVVLLIGILASIGVPQYFKVLERGRVAEVIQQVGALRDSQERFYAKGIVYANALGNLDYDTAGNMKYFAYSTMGTTGAGWSAVFTRLAGNTGYGYGTYNISYTGGPTSNSWNCGTVAACSALLP